MRDGVGLMSHDRGQVRLISMMSLSISIIESFGLNVESFDLDFKSVDVDF